MPIFAGSASSPWICGENTLSSTLPRRPKHLSLKSNTGWVDVNTLERLDGISRLQMNDIARVGVKVQQSLVIDSYARNRATGSFIMIDNATHDTVAAGMIG